MTFRHADKISERFQFRKEFHFDHVDHRDIVPHPNPIFLHYGFPHDGFFPVDSITIRTVDTPFESYKSSDSGRVAGSESKGFEIKRSPESEPSDFNKADHPYRAYLSNGLQYERETGIPEMTKFLREYVSKTHLPCYEDWDSTVSFGTGDGVYKVFDLLLNPGDTVLVEQYTFTPTLSSITCFAAHLEPVDLDLFQDGIDVDKFEAKLRNWHKLYPKERKFPKCLYTIPTGHNPIGTTQSLDTRRRIYELCDEFDILIIEDDPYGFLALAKFEPQAGKFVNPFTDSLSTTSFYESYVAPSYLTIDTSHRVIRMDSFSKTFAPGIRLGAITGHREFIERINLFLAVSTKQPSGFSCLMLLNYYDYLGGFEGLSRWFIKLSREYSDRKQILMGELVKTDLYNTGKIHILEPKHGMFVTIQLLGLKVQSLTKAMDYLEKLGLKHGVIFVLGTRLTFDEKNQEGANFVRLALSPCKDVEELKEGSKRFVACVEEFYSTLDTVSGL